MTSGETWFLRRSFVGRGRLSVTRRDPRGLYCRVGRWVTNGSEVGRRRGSAVQQRRERWFRSWGWRGFRSQGTTPIRPPFLRSLRAGALGRGVSGTPPQVPPLSPVVALVAPPGRARAASLDRPSGTASPLSQPRLGSVAFTPRAAPPPLSGPNHDSAPRRLGDPRPTGQSRPQGPWRFERGGWLQSLRLLSLLLLWRLPPEGSGGRRSSAPSSAGTHDPPGLARWGRGPAEGAPARVDRHLERVAVPGPARPEPGAEDRRGAESQAPTGRTAVQGPDRTSKS